MIEQVNNGNEPQVARGDLWRHVQRTVWPGGNVRMIPVAHTIHVSADEGAWHGPVFHTTADDLLARLEGALASRRGRRAKRLKTQWLRQLHLDRVTYASEVAAERALRFEAIGRGPVVDRPTVHYRDRLPWYLTPVSRYADRRLPEHAQAVLDAWNGSGSVFDGIYVADEPVPSGHFPVHSLVAAISPDGSTADWFILDRWSS